MITRLGRLNPQRLAGIARTSAMRYKAASKTIADIGRELGVSHVLEGSVRRARNRVRIAAQLIQVSDETHLWAESYQRSLGDILRLQSDVARAIAREIRVKLTPREERRLADTPEVSPEAYEAYLKGRHLWNKRTEDGMRKSIVEYEDAIRQHPEYAMAYSGVADSYVMLACLGMMPAKDTFRKAKAAARKALDLDCDLGEAHSSLAHVRLHDWDWEGLERDFQRAIELNPSNTIVYYWYGEFLMSMGKPEKAIAMTEKAHRMDPLSPVIGSWLVMILYLARRYDQAVALLERTQEINPNFRARWIAPRQEHRTRMTTLDEFQIKIRVLSHDIAKTGKFLPNILEYVPVIETLEEIRESHRESVESEMQKLDITF